MSVSWRIDAEVMGVAALVAGDAAAFLAGANPSFFTVRTFRSQGGPDAENTARDIRIGMALGTALTVLVAAGGTAVTGSWWPLVAGLAAAAALDGMYEYALRNPHNRRRNIADQ